MKTWSDKELLEEIHRCVQAIEYLELLDKEYYRMTINDIYRKLESLESMSYARGLY